MIAVVVPFALAAIFSITLSGVSGDSVTFEYAVADEDGGQLGSLFVEHGLGPLEAEGLVDLTRARSAEEGRRLAADGKVRATFVVPDGFTDAVAEGAAAEILVIGNADAPIASQVARSIAQGFASELNAARLAAATALASGSDADPEALAREAAALPSPVSVEDVSAARKELDSETFYAAGMAVFFLFFTVQFGIASLLDERREGTLARLMAAPVHRTAILGGKLLTSYVLGVAATAVLIVASSLLLGADWGNPIGVALLVLTGVLAGTAVMALVASFTRTPEQAGYAGSVVALVLAMLGGSFFPLARVGGVISTLSLLTPHAWFLRGLSDLTAGAGPGAVLPSVGAILAFAAVTGGIAFARLERVVRL
jgi:ABC-2 type transport system permease protein